MLKVCCRCNAEKPLVEFMKDNRLKSGFSSVCLECHRNAENARRLTPEGKKSKRDSDTKYRETNLEELNAKKRLRKAEGTAIINSYKCVPCVDCGRIFPSECMELDHVSDNKVMEVSAMKAMDRVKIIQEIAKCEIVCAVCHRIRTAKRRVSSKEKRPIEMRAMIDEIKLQPCTDCGLCFPTVAMDFDHVRGEKVVEISNMGHYPVSKILEELDKCEIVCANCHRIRTKVRKDAT